MISQRALQMINNALEPMIKRGRRIYDMKLNVSRESQLADVKSIDTRFGTLNVRANGHLEKGCCYIMEDDTKSKGRGFAWIAKPE